MPTSLASRRSSTCRRIFSSFFYFDDNQRGPPFGTSKAGLAALLTGFQLEEELAIPESESIPVFKGKEVWQVWKRPL